MSLNDVHTSGLRQFGNMVHGTPPIVAINAAAAATVKTTNAILHTANGVLKSRAALSAVALAAPTTSTTKVGGGSVAQDEVDRWRFYTLPAGKTCYIVLALDGASTANLVAFQGSYDGQDLFFRGGGVAKGKSVVPDTPDGFVPFGLIKVVGGTATFLPGTDALDKANVTFTFWDIGVLPVTEAP